jgi:virginiamycin B lyase
LPAQKLPDGKGKEVVEAACDGCHGLDQIIGRAWSADKWRSVVKSMIDKGAVLSDDELKTVVDYLAANFGETPAKSK